MIRNWGDIHKPKGVNARSLVAIAYNDDHEAIMLLDIETILSDVVGFDQGLSAPSLSNDGLDWSSLRILLVDDSRSALLLLQSLLDKLGCRHISTQSADQALDFLNNSLLESSPPVNMVISDIKMPGMDGFTLTRTIREIPAFRG